MDDYEGWYDDYDYALGTGYEYGDAEGDGGCWETNFIQGAGSSFGNSILDGNGNGCGSHNGDEDGNGHGYEFTDWYKVNG